MKEGINKACSGENKAITAVKIIPPDNISILLILKGWASCMYFLFNVLNRAAKAALKIPIPIAKGYDNSVFWVSGNEKLMRVTPKTTIIPEAISFIWKGCLVSSGSKIAVKKEADPKQANVMDTELPSFILP